MTSLDVIVTFSDNILTKDTDRNTSLIFNDSIYHFFKKNNYILSILSDFNTSIEL